MARGAATPGRWRCPQCGRTNAARDRYCGGCGYDDESRPDESQARKGAIPGWNPDAYQPAKASGTETLALNLIMAAVVVGLFLFVNPLAGLIGALVGGIVAIRMANAQRR